MLSENPLFSVLVTSGNQAVLAKDKFPWDLAIGQIGVFDGNTNVSLDATTSAKVKTFYLAVGIDPAGVGGATASDVRKSSGQSIQASSIKAASARCYTPEQSQQLDVTDFFAFCDRDYVLKFILTNQSALRRYGKNLPYKSFVHHTSCCATTCTVACKDFGSEVAYGWVNQINADSDKLLKAELLDYTTTPGTPAVVPIDQYQAWVDANTINDTDSDPGNDVVNNSLGVRITTQPSALATYSGLNLGYDYPRGTTITAALGGDFQCTGKVTISRSMVYEEGSGYDIQQLEADASGWYSDRGIYRLSELNGVERQGYSALAQRNGKYVMINIDQFHTSIEDRTYESNLDTLIAIPCGENGTIASLLAVLDAITEAKGFEKLADDLADCPTCNTVNRMRKTYLLDGIA